MSNEPIRYSWVATHKEIVQFLATKQNNQIELIDLLKKVGITNFNDKDSNGKDIDLIEIDPFTFFCYIYKYGSEKRLFILQKIANELKLKNYPTDDFGIPSANAQKVWLFPYKIKRNNDEIFRLWKLFFSVIDNSVSEEEFEDILTIRNVGKTKLTEALFYINPEKYFPIDGPTRHYLKEFFQIDSSFESYSDYLDIIRRIREKTTKPFYEISYDAWISYTNKTDKPTYWIFQGNPKIFNIVDALKNNEIETWTVSAHKTEIKKGDKVILWVTGALQGCYALAEVTSPVYEGRDERSQMKYYNDKSVNEISSRVKLKVTHNLVDSPILKAQIDSNPELSELNVGSQGTNFTATEDEYIALLDLIEQVKNAFAKALAIYPKEDLDFYFKFLKEILNHFQLKIGDERLSFSCKRNRLNFIVGQRYCWNLFPLDSRGKYGVISKEKIDGTKFSEPFEGNQPQPYYSHFSETYYLENNKANILDAIEKELNRSKKSSFRIHHNEDFEIYAFKNEIIINPTQKKDNNMKPLSLNTIFYGPPGTGKTYHTILRAAEIIENKKISDYKEAQRIFNANLEDRIEFITFHQNYSYEDFIQGLRPNVESEGSLSFERKDGVFKRIAVNALFEYYKFRKKQSANKKDKEQKLDENEIYLDFVEHLKSLKSKDFKTSTGSVITISSFTKNDNIEFKHENRSRGYTVSGNRLLKLFEIFPNMQKIKNVHEDIRDAIGGCNTTVYWVALREFIQFYNGYKKNPEIELADEVDEEVSYETKKKLLANLDFGIFNEVKSFDVPSYVIIIDEINRANISRVFGELITLIEPDKRSHGKIPLRCTLPSGEEFIVPSNLFIIGAMNTADKSIALLDIALRRRFVFEAMYPLYEIAGEEIFHKEVLKKLNAEIIKRKGHDFQIGHSYFMGDNKDLPEIMNRKVIPLLLEYFMNDETEVKQILKEADLVVKTNIWPLEVEG